MQKPARADDAAPLPRALLGEVGLVDMPSARMAPDGELYAGASFFQNTQHYNLGFQALPWLEMSFRYTGLDHFGTTSLDFDRSFAAKLRLWDETEIFPAVALGVNDLVGTGLYNGEYLVASKRFGDFDTTFGIGWGRLGSAGAIRNPLAVLSGAFEARAPLSSSGSANFNVYFHGPSGLFGGVVWHTPIDRLSLIAEYSSDRYVLETANGNFTPRNQFNFGASYRVLDNLTVGLQWLYGRSIGASLAFALETATPRYSARIAPPVPAPETRTPEQQQQALAELLNRREQFIDARGGTGSAIARRDGFADALLGKDSDIHDVRIDGRTLVLATAARAGTPERCSNYAQLAQAYEGGITAVSISYGSANGVLQCAVASSPATPADFGAMPSYLAIYPASRPSPAGEMVIDASGKTQNRTDNGAARAIRTDAARQGITVDALQLGESEALVYYTNDRYFSDVAAVGRLTRVLMADAPPAIEKFRLVAVSSSVPQREFDVLRGPVERAFTQGDPGNLFGGALTTLAAPMQNPVLENGERGSYPRFSWSLFPQLHKNLFDPSGSFAVQLSAAAEGAVEFLPGLSLHGEVDASLYDNFDSSRANTSQLPHVRSDFPQYAAKGGNGIGALDLNYRFRLAPDVFALVKAGYLESMFAGGGGEILWRPEGTRWALGADLYDVRQRDFNRMFGLQNYEVVTGHFSLYYQSPWYGLNFALRAGQYLARDRGATLEVTRRFSTGVEIGAFATLTDVSARQSGEGSFNKGFIIRIPLEWALPITTQSQFNADLHPLLRDGGQRLENDTTLYSATQRDSYGEINGEIGDFLNP